MGVIPESLNALFASAQPKPNLHFANKAVRVSLTAPPWNSEFVVESVGLALVAADRGGSPRFVYAPQGGTFAYYCESVAACQSTGQGVPIEIGLPIQSVRFFYPNLVAVASATASHDAVLYSDVPQTRLEKVDLTPGRPAHADVNGATVVWTRVEKVDCAWLTRRVLWYWHVSQPLISRAPVFPNAGSEHDMLHPRLTATRLAFLNSWNNVAKTALEVADLAAIGSGQDWCEITDNLLPAEEGAEEPNKVASHEAFRTGTVSFFTYFRSGATAASRWLGAACW